MDLLIREAKETDWPFIFSSWFKSYNGNERPYPFVTHNDIMYALKVQSAAFVVCPDDDKDQILSWVVGVGGKSPLIHYVYTKSIMRRHGLATMLIKHLAGDEIPDCSHATVTRHVVKAMEKHGIKLNRERIAEVENHVKQSRVGQDQYSRALAASRESGEIMVSR